MTGEGQVPTVWIVVAHGSRAPGTNADHAALCAEVAELAGDAVDEVRPAYLEIDEPTIPDAIDGAVADGAGRVVLLPYFLHAGNHTRRDLPELMDAARERHPDVEIALAQHLGPHAKLAEILLDRGMAVGGTDGG